MSAIAPRRKGWRPEAPRRKGWCPGALRPMETGDGLIARVRAPRGRLSLDQAAAVAESAIACGNGAIGLSALGNLHLRGLSERTLADLHARLSDARLIDADPEIERLSNIVVSPLDDLDPEALLDLSPSAAALETRLAENEDLRRLPAKFSFVLDALGRLPLADVDADIRFEASRDGTLAVFLAGEDALAAECAPAETGEVAARLGRAFIRLAGAGEDAPRRMRALVGRRGANAVFAEAGLAAKPRLRSQRRASLSDLLGAHEFGAEVVVGAAAAFGEIEAAAFKALIERAGGLAHSISALNAAHARTPTPRPTTTWARIHGAEVAESAARRCEPARGFAGKTRLCERASRPRAEQRPASATPASPARKANKAHAKPRSTSPVSAGAHSAASPSSPATSTSEHAVARRFEANVRVDAGRSKRQAPAVDARTS